MAPAKEAAVNMFSNNLYGFVLKQMYLSFICSIQLFFAVFSFYRLTQYREVKQKDPLHVRQKIVK